MLEAFSDTFTHNLQPWFWPRPRLEGMGFFIASEATGLSPHLQIFTVHWLKVILRIWILMAYISFKLISAKGFWLHDCSRFLIDLLNASVHYCTCSLTSFHDNLVVPFRISRVDIPSSKSLTIPYSFDNTVIFNCFHGTGLLIWSNCSSEIVRLWMERCQCKNSASAPLFTVLSDLTSCHCCWQLFWSPVRFWGTH